MSLAEKVELALIVAVAVLFYVLARALPDHVAFGNLLLGASALLLLQGLLRDLWLLAKAKRKPPQNPPRTASCMCVESIIGITGVFAGLILLACEIDMLIPMEQWSWSLFASLALGAGFFMKDYVVEFSPWRIRRDKDHVNIIVRWKR
jgi:uncharacterized membrane protein